MEIASLILSLAALLVIGFLFFKTKTQNSNSQLIESFRNQVTLQIGQINEQVAKLYSDNQSILQKVNTDLTQTLQNVDKNVNSRLDNAAKVISDVHRKLGEVHETTKRVQEIGKDISSLQDILRAPKIRGGMGELFLGDLLKQVLPPSRYQEQYRFKSGEKVDAVIFLQKQMVPIDSKFPLENFNRVIQAQDEAQKITFKKQFTRDVKKHIDDIKKKYILPDEGTFDFALMYILAENVYYEIIIKDENLEDDKTIFKYALDNRVIPVSPNSFYGYLQTILLGLRGMRVEEKAQEILKNLSRLEGDFERVMNDFSTMGTHLKNTFSKFEDTEKRLLKFNDKLGSLEEKVELPPQTAALGQISP
ncbi:MAG: hypothetical protein FD145_883 [Candidatus Saganbacteria bacterium]|uniref:DNA recombination protein RmuC n=1 Tax=Candidatus Saganbacteria bacterium TaxID=2575572 RepID=A0A833L0X5_UNCSA|nr:MAG: hypothetical protein FD145_883 [Candidatus Saganbacteria bacterium]